MYLDALAVFRETNEWAWVLTFSINANKEWLLSFDTVGVFHTRNSLPQAWLREMDLHLSLPFIAFDQNLAKN